MNTLSAAASPQRPPPLYAIFLVSAAALGYEILLMRLFSVVQWHHFAYMVISLALLGYGVSGTFLTLSRRWLAGRFAIAFVTNAILFGISSITCFLIVQHFPFNTLELLWDPDQWVLLLFAYLMLSVPFFFAANCICLAFSQFSTRIPGIYSADLLGAGAGALGIVLALFFMPPLTALKALGGMGLLAAAVASMEVGVKRRGRAVAVLLGGAVFTALLPESWLALNMSQYKGLSQALRVPGTEVVAERSSPLGLLTVIRSPQIPLRYAPGMSLNSLAEPPPQLGLFSDGDFLGAITRYQGDRNTLVGLDYLTSALPFHMSPPRRVLILGLGGGSAVLQAVYQGAEQTDVVELNPQVVELVEEDFRAFSGWSLLEPGVSTHIGEGRGYTAATTRVYDLIQLGLPAASNAASSGLYALSESYLYTTEALQEYMRHLQPDGLLALTVQLRLPPRDGLKLFATAVRALRSAGVDQPGERLAMIRGWQTATLLLKKGRIGEAEIDNLKRFCRERSFDVVYYPGMAPVEANIYNVLSQPYYYQAALSLLGEHPGAFLAEYKFDVSPATDDRPYFHNFFKWSVLPEILSLYGRGGISLLELGYPVLIATLVQALGVSVVLVIFPLLFLKRERRGERDAYAWKVAWYFLAIGLAFLFIEIAFMQRFLLFLSHPIYAIAVVLSGFLVFSGLGSRYARHFAQQEMARPVLPIVGVLVVVALAYLYLLGPLFGRLMGLPDPLKIGISLALIAPLAFCMGMPFPLGLARVAGVSPPLVPWAWGINGCASLLSAILATLLAIHLGFTAVIVLALLLYLSAGLMRL